MKLVSVILLHFFCCSLLQDAKATVPIGGITNLGTRIGREQKVAIKLAIESFSTNDTALLLNTTDLIGSNVLQGNLIVQDLIRWGAKAIITTGTSQQTLIAGTTAGGTKTPIISLLPFSFITRPFMFEISYPEDAFVRCIADFVKLHGWPKIITIYEDDTVGMVSGTNLMLKDALKDVGSKLEYNAVFQQQNNLSDLEKTVEREFDQMMQYGSTVYVVLHISERLALSIFKKAKELNLTSPRYVWICGNDITDLLNSTLSPTFIAKYMQGIVGIKPNINESVEYQVFFAKFRRRFEGDYGSNNESFFNPGVFAVRAYDAVHAVYLASIESKAKNISLVESLSMVNFVGLSGKIVPKNSTLKNRKLNISQYQVFGIVGVTCANLGMWHENSGFNPGMKNLSWLNEKTGILDAVKPGGLQTLMVGIPSNEYWKNFVNVKIVNCSAVIDPGTVTGFCIDVFREGLKFLNYSVSYKFVAYNMDNDSCNVRTYNDLVNLVHLQEVDMVVGDVTITPNRATNVSFSQPFLTSELVMLVYKGSDDTGWLLMKPFSRGLRICIVGILFFFITLVWLLERNDERADRDFHGPIWMQLAASIWLLCSAVFLKIDEGFGSYHTKIVLLCWFILVQVLMSSFTASLSAILVQDKVDFRNDSLKIGYNGQSFVHEYLLSTLNYKPENLVKIDKTSDGDAFSVAFTNGTINVAYLELPYLRVFLETNKQGYVTQGKSRTLGGFGFVFPKRSPLRDDFSRAILKLQEDGIITQLQSQWFPVTLSRKNKEGKQKSLGFTHFAYFFLFTTCFASLTALHKLIYQWWMGRTNSMEGSTQGEVFIN